MSIRRAVSLVILLLCRCVLGDVACPRPDTDASSILQVAAEPEGSPKHANAGGNAGSSAQGSDKSHAKKSNAQGAKVAAKTPDKPVEATVTDQKTSKHNEEMLQSMLDAWGNFLNGLLFG